MAQRIKFSFIKMFFRLFSFLADKTGGWKVFVQPKLLFGTMILGFGVAACNSAGKARSDNDTVVADTIITRDTFPEVTCYDMPAPPDTTKKEITKPKKKAKARKDTVYATPLYGAVRNDYIPQKIAEKPIAKKPATVYATPAYGVVRNDYIPQKIAEKPIAKKPATIYVEPMYGVVRNDYIPLENDSNKIYTFVDVKAQFPGGDKQLMRWIEDNMIYPIVAKENGIQGRVYVNFIVRKDGSIDGVKVLRGVHQSLDNEAIRLIKAMPRWKAGENDKGEKVHSYFTLPIIFILKNE